MSTESQPTMDVFIEQEKEKAKMKQVFGGNDKYTCDNCGEPVTERYWRVFSVDGQLGCCPECPDKIREADGTVREVRGGQTRESHVERTTYDENYGEA